MNNRWYDPEVGLFISEEPIGFVGGDTNLYGYVGNNPLNLIDPFGFRGCPPRSSWGWDAVQGALDVAGLAPGVGIVADLTNAGISVARGNYGDAAFSMAAAVPVLGTAAGAGKIAHKLNKVTKGILGRSGRDALGETKLRGLNQNRSLSELTDADIRKTFSDSPLTLSNHAISRILDPRTRALGARTPNDIAGLLNKGKISDVGRGLISIQRDSLEAIVNPITKTIVTIKPVR